MTNKTFSGLEKKAKNLLMHTAEGISLPYALPTIYRRMQNRNESKITEKFKIALASVSALEYYFKLGRETKYLLGSIIVTNILSKAYENYRKKELNKNFKN